MKFQLTEPRGRRSRRLGAMRSLIIPLACALSLGAPAHAQAGDLTTGYNRVSAALAGAQATLVSDPAAALAQVETARNAFRSLTGQLKSRALQDGGTQALDAAKTAVTRRSLPDLTAQSTQARGVLQRAVYEAYFAAVGLDAGQAARYAGVLATATNLTDPWRHALLVATTNGDVNGARAVLETQYAGIMRNALNAATLTSNRALAFQDTVRASAAYLVVQDSPRMVGGLTGQGFTTALTALTNGDLGAFRVDAKALKLSADAYANAWSGAKLPSVPPAPAKQSPTVKSPALLGPTPNGGATQPAPALPVSAARVAAPGGSTPIDVLTAVQARVSQALAYLLDGRVADAKARLASAAVIFEGARAAVAAKDVGQADRLATLLDSSQNAVGLKPADLGVLASEAQAAMDSLSGSGGRSLRQSLTAAVQPYWVGAPRGVLFLLVALAFLYPIYLMNLAFGGRNPYWRLIGFAMVLLFLAPLAEGLAWLGSALASLTGWEGLEALNALSVLSNPLAQMVWLIVLAACVILATFGFRGIARQFGLLRGPGATTVLEPGGEMATASARAVAGSGITQVGARTGQTSETIVEWDEEL